MTSSSEDKTRQTATCQALYPEHVTFPLLLQSTFSEIVRVLLVLRDNIIRICIFHCREGKTSSSFTMRIIKMESLATFLQGTHYYGIKRSLFTLASCINFKTQCFAEAQDLFHNALTNKLPMFTMKHIAHSTQFFVCEALTDFISLIAL